MTASASLAKSEFVVFYSWQSDLPDDTTRRLIREALRAASDQLEAEFVSSKLHIILDEATRDMPGSPNIPQAILAKICAADAFFCDITTINKERKEGQRAVPNPNVVFELGYAVSQLGWGRVVALFNKAYGAFPHDAPFDFDRHRLSVFEFDGLGDESASLTKAQRQAKLMALKRPLFDLVYEALRGIIVHNPLRPDKAAEMTPEKRKRLRDVDALREVLSTISLPTMDYFLDRVQIGQIPHAIFYYWEGFRDIVTSTLFHVYDEKADKLLKDFCSAWDVCLSFGEFFMPSASGESYIFHKPGDIMTSNQEKAWSKLQAGAIQAQETFKLLISYIRKEYLEIDLKETNVTARTAYLNHQAKWDAIFEKSSSGGNLDPK